jgi:hypothetical protein
VESERHRDVFNREQIIDKTAQKLKVPRLLAQEAYHSTDPIIIVVRKVGRKNHELQLDQKLVPHLLEHRIPNELLHQVDILLLFIAHLDTENLVNLVMSKENIYYN